MTFSHHTVSVPVSTLIQEDLLISYRDLETINKALKKYENATEKKIEVIQHISAKLEHIIKIYNENITDINKKCKKIEKFEFPTFEEYSSWRYPKEYHKSTLSEPTLQDKYEHDKTMAEVHFGRRLEEDRNLGYVGLLFPDFKQKIEKVIQRALAQNLPVQQLPKLNDLSELEVKQRLRFELSLRKPRDAVVPTSTSSTSTSSSSSSSSAQPVLASQTSSAQSNSVGQAEQSVESSLSESSSPASITVTVNYSLSHGTLGICHAPSWSEKPVLFTSTNEGWQGQIPYGAEFKYVIVQDGKIIKWEEGANRRVDVGASAPTAALRKPKFY